MGEMNQFYQHCLENLYVQPRLRCIHRNASLFFHTANSQLLLKAFRCDAQVPAGLVREVLQCAHVQVLHWGGPPLLRAHPICQMCHGIAQREF